MTYIYALIDPNTQEVRYVGKSDDPEVRLVMHLRAYEGAKNPHKNRWIQRLKRSGQKPILQVLEQVVDSDWAEAEKKWIAHFMALGMPLTNIAQGGQEPSHSDESNAKRRDSVQRHWGTLSREQRAERLEAAHEASRVRYQEWAENGVPFDISQRRAAGQLGRKHTEETRRKISAANHGKKVSDETRRKLSDAHRGRKPPPLTDEGRERLREAARARWARVSPEERTARTRKARAAQLAKSPGGAE